MSNIGGEAYLKMCTANSLGDAQNVAMSLLRSNSADPEALVLRGRALYAQGENEKAIQHYSHEHDKLKLEDVE